jgi:hypothetical protein
VPTLIHSTSKIILIKTDVHTNEKSARNSEDKMRPQRKSSGYPRLLLWLLNKKI